MSERRPEYEAPPITKQCLDGNHERCGTSSLEHGTWGRIVPCWCCRSGHRIRLAPAPASPPAEPPRCYCGHAHRLINGRFSGRRCDECPCESYTPAPTPASPPAEPPR